MLFQLFLLSYRRGKKKTFFCDTGEAVSELWQRILGNVNFLILLMKIDRIYDEGKRISRKGVKSL
jgi:hypothetical protein